MRAHLCARDCPEDCPAAAKQVVIFRLQQAPEFQMTLLGKYLVCVVPGSSSDTQGAAPQHHGFSSHTLHPQYHA